MAEFKHSDILGEDRSGRKESGYMGLLDTVIASGRIEYILERDTDDLFSAKVDESNIEKWIENFISMLPERTQQIGGEIRISPENAKLYHEAYLEKYDNYTAPKCAPTEFPKNLKIIVSYEKFTGTDSISFYPKAI